MGSTLAANERKVIFSYYFDQNHIEFIQKYMNIEEKDDLPFNLIINYSAVYEEKWQTNYQNNNHPKKVY